MMNDVNPLVVYLPLGAVDRYPWRTSAEKETFLKLVRTPAGRIDPARIFDARRDAESHRRCSGSLLVKQEDEAALSLIREMLDDPNLIQRSSFRAEDVLADRLSVENGISVQQWLNALWTWEEKTAALEPDEHWLENQFWHRDQGWDNAPYFKISHRPEQPDCAPELLKVSAYRELHGTEPLGNAITFWPWK